MKIDTTNWETTARDDLTQEELVALVGEDNVSKLLQQNCENDCACGLPENESSWTAEIAVPCKVYYDGTELYIQAYYYVDADDEAKLAAADGDGAAINWWPTGFGYQII